MRLTLSNANKSFTQFLITHIAVKPEKNHTSEGESYSCNKCQKTFTNLKSLKIHEKKEKSCLDSVPSFSFGDHFMSAFLPEISEDILEAIESSANVDNIECN